MCMLRQWCSLSMLHRNCENVPRGVRLGRLSMPSGWCTLWIPIYFKPYMVQIELTYISIKCGILIPQGLKINGHVQRNHPLTMLSPPNLTPLYTFSQVLWSMLREHKCLSMCIEPPRTYIRCWISFLSQTWWSPAVDCVMEWTFQ